MPDPKKTTKPAGGLPRLMDVPEYAAAFQRYHSLAAEARELEKKIEAAGRDVKARQANERTELALAKLEGKPVDLEGAARAFKERERLGEEKLVTVEAIRIQAARLETIKAKLSRQICQDVEPVYRALVVRIATLLVELGDACLEEQKFRNGLQDSGVTWCHPLITTNCTAVGDPRDANGLIFFYLQEAIRNHYVGGHEPFLKPLLALPHDQGNVAGFLKAAIKDASQAPAGCIPPS